MASIYSAVYAAWKQAPQTFWAGAAADIDWFTPWESVFDSAHGAYGRWFAGATTNTCWNAVDRHVLRGRAEQTAIIYDSPVTGTLEHWSYARLQSEIEAFAACLLDRGISKGDRVILYMPMVPQAIVAMLACARLGAIHSVVFGGFAAKELATRINDSTPKLIVSASCGIEGSKVVAYKPLLDGALALAHHKVAHCIVLQRPQASATLLADRDDDYEQIMSKARLKKRSVPCVAVAATDPSYILYTSGTTGQPKGVVRDTGGHMVALKWSMKALYGIEPGEVFWAASDVGWVVGHSYIVYAPLLHGCTTVLFEGKPVGTPDPGTFWRVIDDHQVAALFTAPTAFRAIKKEDPSGSFRDKYRLSALRALFLAGERADPDTIRWAEDLLKVPVIDHWWQTETGWAIVGNPMGLGLLPVKHGSPTVPMPGYALEIVDDGGAPVAAGQLGNVVVKLPLPPGSFPTLWQAEERFKSAYLTDFPGYYKTADAGYVDEDGYLYIMARTDDIINVAGHRLSTGGMEEVLSSHPDVAECAVIGMSNQLKGQVPCGFIVLKSGVSKSSREIEDEVVALVRERIGPVAAFKRVVTVARLPKTRSGKILRSTMTKIADNVPFEPPATIDDPAIIDEISAALNASTR